MIAGNNVKHVVEVKFMKKSFESKFRPKFGSLIFPEITYNDSFQQCLACGTSKTHEKKFGDQIWVKGAKIAPETRFFAISSNLVH